MISLQHRLYGGGNRIAWRSADIAAIATKFGLRADHTGVVDHAPRAREFAAPTILKSDTTSDREFTFTISSSAVDRMGDTIAPAGWKLDNFLKNPVVLWMHDNFLVPVGRAKKVWLTANTLKSTVVLAPADINPASEQVRQLIKAGYLSATSVGFAPLKYAFTEDPARRYGIDFLEQELLEWSIVTVPANHECLLDPNQQDMRSAAQKRRQREIDLMKMRG